MSKKNVTLSLTSQEILDKKFNASQYGYDALEVDKYLDNVIKDYRIIEKNKLISNQEYDDLLKRVKELKKENNELEIKVTSLEEKYGDLKDKGVNESNIDLITTLRKYEKVLYKMGIDPKKIK